MRSKSEINDFILEDRTKIPLTLEHEVLGITIDTNLNLYSHLKQLCKKVANKLMHGPELSLILIKNKSLLLFYQRATKLLSPNLDFLFQALKQS